MKKPSDVTKIVLKTYLEKGTQVDIDKVTNKSEQFEKVGFLGKIVCGCFNNSSNGFNELEIAKNKGNTIATEKIARKI